MPLTNSLQAGLSLFSRKIRGEFMRRLVLVVSVLVILSITPTLETIPIQTTQLPSLIAVGAQEPTRVYGINLASEIYAACQTSSYESFVRGLSEIGSRLYRETENNLVARDWIKEQLTSVSYGRVEVEFVGSYNNVVGLLPGYLPGEQPVFVVSAHYDSAANSPGANDDGSGVALVLELARVMSQYEWPLDIYFVAFNAALPQMEFGPTLQGSRELAQIWEDEGIDILALFNVDSILYPYRWAESDERVLLGYAEEVPYQKSQYWAELVKMIGNLYGSDVIRPMASSTFPLWSQSDHLSFYQRGYESVVCAFESGYFNDDVSGTSYDVYTYSGFNYQLGRVVAGVIGGSMALSMGHAYGNGIRHISKGTILPTFFRTYHLAITAATQINVTCRWWGGSVEFRLYDPTWNLLDNITFLNASAWEYSAVLNTAVAQPGLYHIILQNSADVAIGYESIIEYDADENANGILDRYEYWLDSELFHIDSDGDSLSDAMEIIIGTSVEISDTDLDSMTDGWEYNYGFDPRDPADAANDPDNDGVPNSEEFLHGLNPLSSDTDLDLIPDLFELENGLDPLVNDANLDPDEDGRINIVEYMEGTDPQVAELNNVLLTMISIPTGAIILLGVAIILGRKYSRLM